MHPRERERKKGVARDRLHTNRIPKGFNIGPWGTPTSRNSILTVSYICIGMDMNNSIQFYSSQIAIYDLDSVMELHSILYLPSTTPRDIDTAQIRHGEESLNIYSVISLNKNNLEFK